MSAVERVRAFCDAHFSSSTLDDTGESGATVADLEELLSSYVGAEHIPAIRAALAIANNPKLSALPDYGWMDREPYRLALAALPKEGA